MNFGNGNSDKGEQKHAQIPKIYTMKLRVQMKFFKIINTFDTQASTVVSVT